MVSLESGLVNSQGCLEYDAGQCLSPSDTTTDSNVGLSSQGFGSVLGWFTPLASGFPAGLTHDGNGNLYLTDLFPGTVYLINTLGTPISSFSYVPNTGSATGIATDVAYLYLTDSGDDDVDIYTLTGTYLSSFSVAAQTSFPGSITYNSSTGNLYVIDADLTGGDHVFEYAPTTGTLVNTFPLSSSSTDGIAFDAVRCTYWIYDSNSDRITHYDPSFNALESFSGVLSLGFSAGEGVSVIGDILYVAAFGSNLIVSFDLTGANTSFADTCNAPTADIDLTAQKRNDINGVGEVGIPFNWTINLANTGLTGATFDTGGVILQDVLPNGPIYDPPTTGNFSGIIGNNFIACSIESNILTCLANGGSVTIGSNGSFDVIFNVTPTEPGTLDNPPQEGGICQVDPNNSQAETDEDNNSCADSVMVEEVPTAVGLASFEVTANESQAIITWETATEIDNAGFNIYRATSLDGPWAQVNGVLIAAEGDPVSGAYYSFVDTPGRGTFYYRLEDIDFFGISTLHQPALVEMGAALRIPWYRPSLPQF